MFGCCLSQYNGALLYCLLKKEKKNNIPQSVSMFKHLLDRSGLTWLTVQSHADIMLFDRITSFFFQTCEYDEATARLSFSLLRDGG